MFLQEGKRKTQGGGVMDKLPRDVGAGNPLIMTLLPTKWRPQKGKKEQIDFGWDFFYLENILVVLL